MTIWFYPFLKTVLILLLLGFAGALIIQILLPDVFAQEFSVDDLKTESVEEQGIGCDIWQVSTQLYVPVYFTFQHDAATERDPYTKSNDPASELFFTSGVRSSKIETNSTDWHRVDLVLDFTQPIEGDERVTKVEIFSGENQDLMQELVWSTTGDKLCKIISFYSEPAPHILTEEEFIEKTAKFHSTQYAKILSNQDSNQDFFSIVGMIVIATGGGMAIAVIVVILAIRGISKAANKPVKKMNEQITDVRNLRKDLVVVKNELMNICEKVTRDVDKKIGDLQIVSAVNQEKFEPLVIEKPEKESKSPLEGLGDKIKKGGTYLKDQFIDDAKDDLQKKNIQNYITEYKKRKPSQSSTAKT